MTAVKVSIITVTWIDTVVGSFMRAYKIPGVAVTVVRPNKLTFLRVYSVRTPGQLGVVDVHTQPVERRRGGVADLARGIP